jgi:acyl-CoA thioester hydrolase
MASANLPTIYSYTFVVDATIIDRNNHINNVEYLKIGLHAATTHWKTVTENIPGINALWVVKRHEIDYIAQAFEGDELQVNTWIESIEGATCYRHITIINARTKKDICKIITQWYMLDATTKRPKRVSEEVNLLFGLGG